MTKYSIKLLWRVRCCKNLVDLLWPSLHWLWGYSLVGGGAHDGRDLDLPSPLLGCVHYHVVLPQQLGHRFCEILPELKGPQFLVHGMSDFLTSLDRVMGVVSSRKMRGVLCGVIFYYIHNLLKINYNL